MLALLKIEGLTSNEPELKESKELSDEEKILINEIENLKAKIANKKDELNSKNINKNINLINDELNNNSNYKQTMSDKLKNPNMSLNHTLKGHFGKVQALAWASHSNELVSASQDGKILVWNVQTGNKRLAISLTSGWTMCCDWSSDSTLIASGGLDNVCTIYNIESDHVGWVSKQPECELVQHQGYVSCTRFINNGRLLTCSGDSSIIYWDVEYKKPIQQWKHHSADVNSVDLCNDNQTFVSVSCDSTCKVWDINRESRPIYSFKGLQNDLNDVRWFPDYKSFAVACDDSELILYDWLSRQKIVSYQKPEIKSNAIGIDFSKSGSYIFATYDGEPWCCIWNTLTGKFEQRLDHFTRPSAMQMSPDGDKFATGSWDNKIRLWG